MFYILALCYVQLGCYGDAFSVISFIECLNPHIPINPVRKVKNSAALIKSNTRNSTFTPPIVKEEKIKPEILSAKGDKMLSIRASKFI